MGKSRFVFVEHEELVEINLGDGDWIKVRPRLSWGDRLNIRGGAVRMDFGGTEGEVETALDLEEMNIRLVERAIVEWNLKDPEGKLMPISRESILALDEEAGDAILEYLGALYPQISEEQKNV